MFHTNTKNGLTILTADTLSGVCHGFSTRPGGVSPAPWDSLNLGVGRGDDIARVQENYCRFCAALGTDVNRVVLSKQIHEDVVRHVTEADAGKGLWRDRVHVDEPTGRQGKQKCLAVWRGLKFLSMPME